MKFKYASFIMITVALMGVCRASAQEWSSAQKEVWKAESDLWSLMSKGDMNAFFDCFHADYVGWDYDAVLPSNKEESKKMLSYFTAGSKMPFYEIKPLSIKIYGDMAFAHYYYTMAIEKADGKKKVETGRWTDILMKQNGKWLLIGDHGGSSPEKED
jgi:ketosteroid isomerase-like protein